MDILYSGLSSNLIKHQKYKFVEKSTKFLRCWQIRKIYKKAFSTDYAEIFMIFILAIKI